MASVAELDVLIKMQTEGQQQLNLFNGQLLTAAVGLGLVYEVGKSVVSNYEDQQQALGDLTQAFATQNQSMGPGTIAQIDAFFDRNKQLIASEYDAEDALAAAVRAGFRFTDAMHMETEAMNLAILKHESMSAAMDTLIKASQGSGKALLDLGIKVSTIEDPVKAVSVATKEAAKADFEKAAADRSLVEELDRLHAKHTITQADLDHLADIKAKDLAATQADTKAHQDLADAQAALVKNGNKWAETQAIIDQRTQNADASLTELQKDQRSLNHDWDQFSNQTGPQVTWALDQITKAADNGVQILGELDSIIGAIANDPSKIGTAISSLSQQSLYGPGISGGTPTTSAGERGTRPGPTTQNNTFNITGQSDPQMTARAVAAVMRQVNRI